MWLTIATHPAFVTLSMQATFSKPHVAEYGLLKKFMARAA